MSIPARHVLIIGGGVAGWSVARRLARARIRCTVLDTSPWGSLATLQSPGIWYGGARDIADEPADKTDMIRGYRWIASWVQRRGGYVSDDPLPCYYLFRSLDQCLTFIESCDAAGIGAQMISRDRGPQSTHPILGDSSLARFVVKVSESPVDVPSLALSFARDALEHGARFSAVNRVQHISGGWRGDHWVIADHDGRQFDCDAVVVAGGPHIPEILARLELRAIPSFSITKTPVLVMHGEVSDSVLLSADRHMPDIVPIHTLGRPLSLCLIRRELEASSASDEAVPTFYRDLYAQGLAHLYRGTQRVIGRHGGKILAHMYAFPKLRLVVEHPGQPPFSNHHIELAFSPDARAPKNVFILSPSGLTAIEPVAERCFAKLVHLLGEGDTSLDASPLPPGARPLLYGDSDPDLQLTSRNSRVVLEEKNNLTRNGPSGKFRARST